MTSTGPCGRSKVGRRTFCYVCPQAFFCFLLLHFSPIFSLAVFQMPQLTDRLEEATFSRGQYSQPNHELAAGLLKIVKNVIFLHMHLKAAQPSRIFHELVKAKCPATNSSIHLGHVTRHATQAVNTLSTRADTRTVV